MWLHPFVIRNTKTVDYRLSIFKVEVESSRQKATNSSQPNSNSQSNKSHTSGFSRRPGSSQNPTNHTPHNSVSSGVCIVFRQIIVINCYVFMVLSLMSSDSMMSESTAYHYEFPIHPSDI
jgi:hypothetical protein